VEQLEERWVPATVQFVSGSLFIRPSTGEAALKLTVTQPAANTFTVKDGASSLGTYAGVANINITGANGADSITVNLNGNAYTGSLLVNSGNGNDTIDLQGNGGSLGGSITLQTGLGNDSVSMNASTTGTIRVGGQIQATDTAGTDSITFGNASAPSSFLGTVNLTGMNVILVGPVGPSGLPTATQPDFYGGDFNASLGAKTNALDFEQGMPTSLPLLFAATPLTIAGSLRLTGGPATDTVLTGAMSIGKDLVISTRGDQSLTGGVMLAAHQSGVTTVGGNFSYTGTGPANFLDLANADFQGNVTLNLGDGQDSVALDQPYLTTNGVQTIIGGSLTINKGNGDLDTAPFDAIQAQIGGNVFFNLGTGNDTMSFGDESMVGGTITVRTGNGNNELDLMGPQSYNVNAIFGSGNDTVTLNNPGAVLNGYLDGGGGTNVLNQVSGQMGNVTLRNF
jgi:hypothetical protein